MFRSADGEDALQVDTVAVSEVFALKSAGKTNNGEEREGAEYTIQVSDQADRELPNESMAKMVNFDATPAVLRLMPSPRT